MRMVKRRIMKKKAFLLQRKKNIKQQSFKKYKK